MKKLNLAFGLCVTVLILCSGCAAAQRGAIFEAQFAMDKQQYESATNYLSQAEFYKKPTPDRDARITLMKGVCYAQLNMPKEAETMFKYVIDHYPNTQDGSIAREWLAVCPFFLEVVAAKNFIKSQHKLNLLPGDNKDTHGKFQAYGPQPLPHQVKYPFSCSFNFIPDGQESFTNHYTVGRANSDSVWQLQRAWQTGSDGQTLEEWPVK